MLKIRVFTHGSLQNHTCRLVWEESVEVVIGFKQPAILSRNSGVSGGVVALFQLLPLPHTLQMPPSCVSWRTVFSKWRISIRMVHLYVKHTSSLHI
jgi:hypothetical protein